MATNLNPAVKRRSGPSFFPSMSFRRKAGRIKIKKVQRKIRLKSNHILLSFLLLSVLFYAVHRIYLFLITWDKFNIEGIEVTCPKSTIRKDVEQFVSAINLGNIFLLDIARLQEILSAHTWIKEVHIRKFFPSSLKIEITERKPIALLKKESTYLVDKEGVRLCRITGNERYQLPLLVDSNGFSYDYKEKIALAWECLRAFASSPKVQVDIMDLSQYGNIRVKLKGSPTWLIFGKDRFAEKYRSFQNNAALFEKFGSLEYVDLRFQNRYYLKPVRKISGGDILSSDKETN